MTRHLIHIALLRKPPAPNARWFNCGRWGMLALYGYFIILVTLLVLEDRMLFHPQPASSVWADPPSEWGVQDVAMHSADGETIHGWWFAPQDWQPEDGALLHCHGKGSNVSFLGDCARRWSRELRRGVLLFDYPGFGKCTGSVSEAGCYASADAAYDWLTTYHKIPADKIVVHGHSLGGAVAIDLASRRPHEALAVTGTFTTFADAAQANVIIFPAHLLVSNRFESLEKIRDCKRPTLIAHGTDDRRVPFWQGEQLFEASGAERKHFVTLDGAGHNVLDHPDVWRALTEFVKR